MTAEKTVVGDVLKVRMIGLKGANVRFSEFFDRKDEILNIHVSTFLPTFALRKLDKLCYKLNSLCYHPKNGTWQPVQIG